MITKTTHSEYIDFYIQATELNCSVKNSPFKECNDLVLRQVKEHLNVLITDII